MGIVKRVIIDRNTRVVTSDITRLVIGRFTEIAKATTFMCPSTVPQKKSKAASHVSEILGQ